MEIAHVEFDCIEFQDITGEYRLIHGCSLKNREELRSRFSQLQKFLDNSSELETVRSLYERDTYFRHLCHRCLELSGISLEWVDFHMMTQMLFPYQAGEYQGVAVHKQGILIELNFPVQNNGIKSQKGATYEELVAALWSHTEDLQKALELSSTLSADQLLDIMQARSKQMQDADPQKREKAQQREWQQKARQDLEKDRGQQQ
ncbi:hypothetical protein [Trichormus variabilis]|uniref:Uncharacterized protein n=1 Tax=Trichormus variabilis SAG 1403-4b TaxID=447716 RepID=A0A433UF67_ANAVA|nr:hypothetical protein [Trichormus variabilis]MBD2628495.1 hypothetical protein [Trichormus variabilis FACHB-164]RUS92500.1 hypothetical protein DSM107003_49830 [Trichormus variabilis SAG 1403-4b]